MTKSLTEPLARAELENLPAGQLPAMWNPFASVTGHPIGLKNAKAWQRLHDDPNQESISAADDDSLEDILHAAQMKMAGIGEVRHPETGEVVAVFPDGRAHENSWQSQSFLMHAQQRTVDLEEKPSEEPKPSAGHGQQNENRKPPRFEDSAESKRLRSISRGD